MERSPPGDSIILAGVRYVVARSLAELPGHRTLLLREAQGNLVARIDTSGAEPPFDGRLSLLSRIPSPAPAGLVSILAASVVQPEPFVLRRFVDGLRIDELEDRFHHAQRAPADTAAFMRRLAAPIQALHAAGLAHGRLHPGNVFVGAGELPLVVDSLIAVPRPGDRSPSANPRAALYSAPEVLSGAEPNAQSDVWSLALRGACVLAGRGGSGAARALSADPTPECAARLGFTNEVGGMLARALSPEPARRPADAGEFASEFASAVLAKLNQTRTGARRPEESAARRTGAYVLVALLAGAAIGRITAPAPAPGPAAPPTPGPVRTAPTPRPRTPSPTPRPSPTAAPRPTATPAATPEPRPPELQRGLRSRWFAYVPARVKSGADPWGAEFLQCDAVIPAIDFDFGEGAPFNLSPDNFAFLAEAYLYVPLPGRYRFIADVDDGCAVTIGAEAFGNPSATGRNELSMDLSLDQGLVPVSFQYAESTGAAHARLDWIRPDGVRERVPPAAFHSPRANTPARLEPDWQSTWDRLGDAQRTRVLAARVDALHGLPAERADVEVFPAPLFPVSLPFAANFARLRGDLPAPWRIVRRDNKRIDASGKAGALLLTLVPDDSAGPRTDMSNLVGIRLDEDKRRFTVRVRMRFPGPTPNQRLQQAGIFMAEDWHGIPDQDNFVRVAFGYDDRSVLTRMVERGGTALDARHAGIVDPGSSWFWLAVQRHGENFGAFASSDGINWISVMEFAAPHAIEHVGIYAIRGGPGASLPVEVESFAISADLEIRPEMLPK